MATDLQVSELLQMLNQIIIAINNADSSTEVSALAKKASQLDSGMNFGRGQEYVSKISKGFATLSMRVGTAQASGIVEDINETIDAYHHYLLASWWQYGGNDPFFHKHGFSELPPVMFLQAN